MDTNAAEASGTAQEQPMQGLHETRGFQITKIWARNFRSVADISVELDRLTVLVGPNAAGKSNVLDILRFIKDALRFDLEVAVSRRHGLEAIRCQTEAGQTSDIELGLAAQERHYALEYSFVLATNAEGSFRVRRECGRVQTVGMEKSLEFRIENGKPIYPEQLIPANPSLRAEEIEAHPGFDTSELWLLRMIPRSLPIGAGVNQPKADAIGKRVRVVLDRFRRQMLLSRFYHFFPNTIREPRRIGDPYPLAEDASNLASVLRYMEKQGVSQTRHFRDSLSLLIPGVSGLQVTPAGGYLVVSLEHDSGQDRSLIDLSQESDGTIRLLALLAALNQRRRLPLMGIEEPELTVHPGAMAPLADILNEATRHCQVIMTTHSPDLIDCLTDYRTTESLRIVELVDGVTMVRRVADGQAEAVRQHLFSPGELHRMGELESPRE